MKSITIFGKGNMGSAIGGLFAKAGNSVTYLGSKDVVDTVGDIVVLAVPYAALEGIITTNKELLDGKIVIDITNPVNFETFDGLVVPNGSSAAEGIAERINAHVVKGFNTNFAATLATGTLGDVRTTVLLAADDADAKKTVIQALDGSGVNVKDAGTLKRARELESLGFLQLSLAVQEKISWTGGFAIV